MANNHSANGIATMNAAIARSAECRSGGTKSVNNKRMSVTADMNSVMAGEPSSALMCFEFTKPRERTTRTRPHPRPRPHPAYTGTPDATAGPEQSRAGEPPYT